MNKHLISIQLRAIWNSIFGKMSKTGKRKTVTKVLIGILALYCIACILLSSGLLFYGMGNLLIPQGFSILYFGIAGIFCILLCFIGTIFTIQSQLFQARDNELLLSLPIRPRSILFSRMAAVILMEVVLAIFILLPAVLVYGTLASFSLSGIFSFLIGCVLLILLGTAFSCFLGWLASLISLRMRHRNLVTVCLMLLFFLAGYGLFFSLQGYFSDLLLHGTELQEALKTALPPVYWFGAGALGDSTALFYLAAWCLLPFGGVCLLLSKTFWRLALSRSAAAKRWKTVSAGNVHGAFHAMARKELFRFFSLPAYILNTAIGSVFLLLFSVFLLINKESLFSMLELSVSADLIFPFCGAVLGFCTAMNCCSGVSLSLEGKSLWIPKSLPIPPHTVLLAKTVPAVAIGIPFILIAAAACCLSFSFSPLQGFLLFLLPMVLQIFTAFFGITVNLLFPRFDWVNETLVIKQSVSSVVSALGVIAMVLLPSLLYFPLYPYIGAELYLFLCCVFFGILSLGCFIYLRTAGSRRFTALQG